jgi:hypothetical protein
VGLRARTVYVFPDEALYELSNDTIHGLLHLGVAGDRVWLAVYVKHRGIASRLYMAAIWPARHRWPTSESALLRCHPCAGDTLSPSPVR